MGEVFRATDEQLGREVAVKLMLPSDRDPQAAERFQREARSAAMLNDPHLVAVYDFGQHEDQFFLVMELVEGRTVSDELTERGALPKDRATNIVEQAAAGLAAAHRQDVVHRDVKPSNLLLTPDGTVKVADFGIAHLAGDGSTTLTAPGQIIGSTNYLAPERAQGRRAGKASDVYSLGCVLYQLVTGQPPFTAEHPTAILYQHVDTPPTPPSATRPELSGSFETVLLRMLAKDPDDRPTAAEIAAGALRLAPSDGDAGVPAVVPTAETAVVEPATPITPLETARSEPAEDPADRRDRRRRHGSGGGGRDPPQREQDETADGERCRSPTGRHQYDGIHAGPVHDRPDRLRRREPTEPNHVDPAHSERLPAELPDAVVQQSDVERTFVDSAHRRPHQCSDSKHSYVEPSV